MISLTTWIYIITKHLESKQKKNAISKKIKDSCLVGEKKILNTYQVDNVKVWENIIMRDFDCKRKLQELKINDVLELESYYYSREERIMWRSYKSTYKKIKR